MNIHDLVPDIYAWIKKKEKLNDELRAEYSDRVSRRVAEQFSGEARKATLRLSAMGPRCPKALWFSIHHPELAEPIPPQAEVKYAFGHMIEALAITLAKAAGHEVVGEQDELQLDGVVGHRDCIIDGCLVDVKSTSSRSFIKFKSKDFSQSDHFGYLDQLDGYVVASQLDPLLKVKDKGYILAIDKQLGHMVLYEHRIREDSIRQRISEYKSIVGTSSPPRCECGTRPVGNSGNIGLDIKASYSSYKHCCFPLLRTFLYSDGPVFLTKVARKPDVPEIFRR